MPHYYWINKTNNIYKIASVACHIQGNYPHRQFQLLRDIHFSGFVEMGQDIHFELYQVDDAIGSEHISRFKVLDMLNGKEDFNFNLSKFGEIKFTLPTNFNDYNNSEIDITERVIVNHTSHTLKSNKWELEIIKTPETIQTESKLMYCFPVYYE